VAEVIDYAPPEVRRLPLPEPLVIDRLDDLATTLRMLPYGPFTEFAQATGCDPAKLWQWATERGDEPT